MTHGFLQIHFSIENLQEKQRINDKAPSYIVVTKQIIISNNTAKQIDSSRCTSAPQAPFSR